MYRVFKMYFLSEYFMIRLIYQSRVSETATSNRHFRIRLVPSLRMTMQSLMQSRARSYLRRYG